MKNDRREFLKKSIVAGASVSALSGALRGESETREKPDGGRNPEWRNRQSGMHYRKLGGTGLMVSEFVMGAFVNSRAEHVQVVLDLGLNYLDTASRYAGGRTEEAIGVLNSVPGNRDRYFIATKVSGYLAKIDQIANEILNGLPSGK